MDVELKRELQAIKVEIVSVMESVKREINDLSKKTRPFITSEEARAMLGGISRVTLLNYVNKGLIEKPITRNKYSRSSIVEFMQRRKQAWTGTTNK